MKASPHQISPYILDIAGKSRISDVSISGTAAQTAALNTAGAGGVYDIWADTDCFIKVAEDASGVTTSNGYEIFAGKQYIVYVPTDHKIGVISGGTAGTLKIHQSRTF